MGWEQVIRWMLGAKTNDPIVRYSRLALIVFAVAGAAIFWAKGKTGQLVFFALFIIALAICLWFATLMMKSTSGPLRTLGHGVGATMVLAILALFLCTVSYLIMGAPQFMGRWLGADPIRITYVVYKDRVIGPLEVPVGERERSRQIIDKIMALLPVEDRRDLFNPYLLDSVSLTAFKPEEFPGRVSKAPLVLSNVADPLPMLKTAAAANPLLFREILIVGVVKETNHSTAILSGVLCDVSHEGTEVACDIAALPNSPALAAFGTIENLERTGRPLNGGFLRINSGACPIAEVQGVSRDGGYTLEEFCAFPTSNAWARWPMRISIPTGRQFRLSLKVRTLPDCTASAVPRILQSCQTDKSSYNVVTECLRAIQSNEKFDRPSSASPSSVYQMALDLGDSPTRREVLSCCKAHDVESRACLIAQSEALHEHLKSLPIDKSS